MVEFVIPKKRYTSKNTKDRVVVLKMPKVMISALDARSEKFGWKTPQLIDMVLDQFYSAMEDAPHLPKHKDTFMEGKRQSVSLRLDTALYEAIQEWTTKASPKPKVSALIFLALDMFLVQTKKLSK